MHQRRKIVDLFIILFGTLLALHLFGGTTFTLSAFEVETSISLSTQNKTSIIIKPFGEIQARTHEAPFSLELSLTSMDLERLEEDLTGRDPKDLLEEVVEKEGLKSLYFFFFRLFLLGGVGGGVSLFLVRRERRTILDGLLIGLLVIASLLLPLYRTYDVEAFRNPSFKGMLEAAPWMMGLVEEGLKNIHRLGEQVRIIAKNIGEIFDSINAMEVEDLFLSQRRVLHVSDIHNNPVAFHFIEEMVKTFQVEMVIDTGDLTDYGTALETEIAASINRLPVPYIFIPGNHDSPAVIDYIREVENVIVLEGDTVNMDGLLITGLKDPAAQGRHIHTPSIATLEEYQEGLMTLFQQLERAPDIVAVHNIQLASPLIGEVPAILHGHSHSMKVVQKEGTVMIDAGTTGAAGLRGLEGVEEIPFSLALLHYIEREEGGYRPIAVDLIQVRSRGEGFQLERVAIEPG